MSMNLDAYFGLHEKALFVRNKRAELLATNLTNADTPNYKARDIDFRAALDKARAHDSGHGLKTTHAGHINTGIGGDMGLQPLYRVPTQPSMDGNTVDNQKEHVEFARNAVEYQASLRFINGKIKGLLSAIRGE